jgi:hypothetical protein
LNPPHLQIVTLLDIREEGMTDRPSLAFGLKT